MKLQAMKKRKEGTSENIYCKLVCYCSLKQLIANETNKTHKHTENTETCFIVCSGCPAASVSFLSVKYIVCTPKQYVRYN